MLNDTRVRNAKRADRPIKLSDSGGLHLLIQPNGSKLWRLAYRFGGKQKTLAIGVYPTVTLKHAREKRDEAKRCSPIVSIPRRTAGWKSLRLGLCDGAGSATGSGAASMILAWLPASRAASMTWTASIPLSSSSSLMLLTPPVCSTRISLGTKSTSSFKKTAGCCFITLSIAARPPRRKAACISRMVSALRA